MAEHVRVGVVGTSWFADILHLPSLASHPHAEISAICGRNRDRAEEVARKYAIPHVFTDYREMIASGMLDALIVITPDALHYPITMAALDAGLHVLCEKALALTAAHAKEMYVKAEAGGRKHMTFFTSRWLPPYRYLHHLIEQGYIGRCYHCHLRQEGGYGREASYGWRFDRQHGNGILGDLGSHLIDLARWNIGEVAKVSGHLATFVERPGVDGQPLDAANDAALVALEFANGAHGTIHVSAVAHVGDRGQDTRVAFYGDSGSLELDFTFSGTELRGLRQGEEHWQILEIPDDLWQGVDRTASFIEQVFGVFQTQSVGDRLFIDSILEDRSVSPSFDDGWKAQEVIDAAIASHEQGRWVDVPTTA
ncbi:MAG TPA: Gfo/Idh/MocA family oxidoreductase [Herpetosiphonaceae bacterium]|nr:Gfo/Idh/MocA family oxidoreductase [Herpetosiphonaceae bacterium]